MNLLLVLVSVVVLLIVVVIVLSILRGAVKVARADEALVISGRRQRTETGDSPVTVIVNGRAIVNPITQRGEVISLRSRQVSLTVEAQSDDNVTLDVDGVAIVKIGSTPELVRRAAERFASQDKAIELFTTEQLEGALRGVIATLSVAELMRDRKRLSEQIAADVSTELADQGLVLDSFQIKGISDRVGYIESLGVPQIQQKRQEAEIAQTQAERAITERKIATEEQNLVERTALARNTADSDAEVGKAQANAEQAAALARAQAEQAVLVQQAENRQAQLDAEVKRVADAKLYDQQKQADARAYAQVKEAEAKAASAQAEADAIRVRAEAEAAATQLAGEAKAAAIKAEADALAQNQQAVLAQRLVDVLPQLVSAFAQGYAAVGEITVIGGSPSEHLAGEQAASLASTLKTVQATTGIDLAALIQGRAVGEAIGTALAETSSN